MNQIARTRPTIRFAPGLWDIYDGSIRRRKPEQYAVLAGRYDDPFRVTDFRPMPAMARADGTLNASTTHVQIDKKHIDHYINNELKPAQKNMVGAIHSHPGRFNQLSGSVHGSDGDIPAMRATLERAQKMGLPWEYFLAPIVNFNNAQTEDTITGWIVTLAQKDPIQANIVFEETAVSEKAEQSSISTETILDQVIDHLDIYQGRINRILEDSFSPQEDKEIAVGLIRRLRNGDLKHLETRALELLQTGGL